MDPCSSPTETKLSQKESSFPAEVPLRKSVGAANRQSPQYLENLWLCTPGTPRLGCVLTYLTMSLMGMLISLPSSVGTSTTQPVSA